MATSIPSSPSPSEEYGNAGSEIIKWYDSTNQRLIDLIGDYAGQELFLIEGDGLLREAFEDERIDYSNGFQLLHACYVVEKLLSSMLSRGSNFHIAFIDDHKSLCLPSHCTEEIKDRYLLSRSIIIRHLVKNLSTKYPDVKVLTFNSLDSEGFGDYLHTAGLHFVMLHDGTSSLKLPAVKGPGSSDKESMRAIIAWFSQQVINVALVNRIEIRDTKVFTIIVGTGAAKTIPNPRTYLPKPEIQLPSVDLSIVQKWVTESGKLDQSERLHLAFCSITILLVEEKVEPSLASAFLMHIILMNHLSLTQRSFPSIVFENELEAKIQKLLTDVSVVAEQLISAPTWKIIVQDKNLEFDLVDFCDGRLLKATISALSRSVKIPTELKADFDEALAVIEAVSGYKLPLSVSATRTTGNCSDGKEKFQPLACAQTQKNDTSVSKVTKSRSVLPFTNAVFDKHLSLIQISTEEDHSKIYDHQQVFRDTTHWHNRRPVVQKKPITPVIFSKRRNPLKTLQFRMAEITAYAASLTGTSGKVLSPDTIITDQKSSMKPAKGKIHEAEPEKSKRTDKETPKGKKGAPKKPAALSKAEIIKASNSGKKAGLESDKAFSAWQSVIKVFNEVADDQQRYLKVKTYLAGLDSKSSHIIADILLYQLQALLSWWAKYCKKDKASGYHVVALLWMVAQSFPPASTTKEIAAHVQKICTLVGILSVAQSVQEHSAPDRKLSFAFKYPDAKIPLRIELSEIEFQLEHCGPYMDRSTDGKPDSRVTRFIPDGWQRKVLDELDANRSIFVVAPTSSGKTFISFYAMEKVLRASNDDVLVYVAPTKALVNQIAAEIQAQFRKSYPQAGRCVWAIHTRDNRVNEPSNCQILVTVPHILQIMLLAPTNAKSWTPRVKRIIFDEIHSIGQAEDGVVWEQLLLLAPCPIIALSATVGNPEQFRDWLASTQKASGTELTMIQHHTRYSDLRKYTYRPPKTFDFRSLGRAPELGCALGLDGLAGFDFLHPVASLVDKSRGMPPDLSLEPRDCLLLYKAMIKHENGQFSVPRNLAPEKSLPPIIRKSDVYKWEEDLKSVLLPWMVDRASPFDTVVEELSPKCPASHSNILNGVGSIAEPISKSMNNSTNPSDSTEAKEINADNIFDTTLPLLCQLNERNALPAILFHYDRAGCENIADKLLAQLAEAENTWKATSPSWKKTMKDYAKYQEAREMKQSKKAPKASKQKGEKDEDASNGNSKDARMREEASSETSIFDLFDPEEPHEDFSFADKKKCQRIELEGFVKQLRYKRIPEKLISLLYRGIGVHHSGMNRKYRQCVEILFRKSFLRVVVATGTLALGINMPCATVVFAGDSIFLTALNFRQSAGRSGRRNFDLLGNVVFQNVTQERVYRLLSSRLPHLTGHFPITTSLVLRLCTLLHQSKSSPYAIKAIDALLSQPRMYLGGQSFREQVLHHLRFSLEYLRRQSLLGPNGEPVNLTSCVSHLYFTENSAFAFHALLKSDYFTALCAQIDTNTSKTLRTLMLTMSHLFGRKHCREIDDKEEAEKIRRSPSMVYLEPLPKEAADVLQKHNEETLDIFSTYTKTFAEQHLRNDEDELPLTAVKVGLPSDGKQTAMLENNPKPATRSAFVALSGYGDNFKSISDLCTSTREGIFLEEAVIPYLSFQSDESRTPANAYLLDFFMHGSLKPLEDANGIRKSDVWFDLNDFSLVLATIVTSLANYLALGNNPDIDMLDTMGMGDVGENEGDEDMAAEMMPAPGSSVTNIQAAANDKPIGRGKIAEDWSLAEDALSSAALKGSFATVEDDEEQYAKLMNVYKAFQMLKTEFDVKFRAIFA